MNIRTLITPSLLAAGLLLGMTPAVQADSRHAPGILHNDAIHDVGYRYGDHGYDADRHQYKRHCGRHCAQHKKNHWHRGHHRKHDNHYGYRDGHKKAHRKDNHGEYRNDGYWQRRHRDDRHDHRRYRS